MEEKKKSKRRGRTIGAAGKEAKVENEKGETEKNKTEKEKGKFS